MYPILAENPQTGFCSSSKKKKHTLCYSTWMKEERTAGLLVSETFCLALVSDTFGWNKALGAIELSSQYLSKDLQIYISRNGVHLYCKRICMQNTEVSRPFFSLRGTLSLLI